MLIEFWQQQLAWDGEDITGKFLKNEQARAIVVAKSNGILAGREECEFFAEHEGFSLVFAKNDGEEVQKGEKILELFGSLHTLLRVERVLLNFLSRLSGIATMTIAAKAKMNNPDVLLCPTRKTLWGAIDKKGVVVGGGGTHRLGLFDAILLKENHLLSAGGVGGALKQVSSKAKNSFPAFWEIEVETEAEAYAAFSALPPQRPGGIMFDNFSPSAITHLLLSPEARAAKESGIFFEASGGITLDTIAEYAQTGVSALSCGLLTNAVTPVDYSMRIQ